MTADSKAPNEATGKGKWMVGLMILTIVSVSGAFMGMRHSSKEDQAYAPWLNHPDVEHAHHEVVQKAPRYSEISGSSFKVDSEWLNSLSNLPKASEKQSEIPVMDEDARKKAVALRTSRRAYDGAPPVIPHAIETIDVRSCVACHGEGDGLLVAGKKVPVMSHPMLQNCTQCHAPSVAKDYLASDKDAGLKVANYFKGVSSPGSGKKAYDSAPPVIPHRLNMRQNCMACHGNGMTEAISTSHPQRKNCLQCHAPNAKFDNRERFLNK